MLAPAPGMMPMMRPTKAVQMISHQWRTVMPTLRWCRPSGIGRPCLPLFRQDGRFVDHRQGLGDGEKPDQRRDQRHPVVQFEEPEGRPRRGVDLVSADRPDQQAEEAGDQALQHVLGGDDGDQGEPEQHDHHHLDAADVIAEPDEVGEGQHDGDRGDQPAEDRGGEAAGPGPAGPCRFWPSRSRRWSLRRRRRCRGC